MSETQKKSYLIPVQFHSYPDNSLSLFFRCNTICAPQISRLLDTSVAFALLYVFLTNRGIHPDANERCTSQHIAVGLSSVITCRYSVLLVCYPRNNTNSNLPYSPSPSTFCCTKKQHHHDVTTSNTPLINAVCQITNAAWPTACDVLQHSSLSLSPSWSSTTLQTLIIWPPTVEGYLICSI